MKALVDSALPFNSMSQNWGCTIHAYNGRIGSGYIGPAIMGEDVAVRMYTNIISEGPDIDSIPDPQQGRQKDMRYVKVPMIQHHSEIRNNSSDMAHVEISFWQLRGNRHAWQAVKRVRQLENGIATLASAPRTDNVLDWFRWEMNNIQTDAFSTSAAANGGYATQTASLHDNMQTNMNPLDTAAEIPSPPMPSWPEPDLTGKTVPISDMLGQSMSEARTMNKLFKCIKRTSKTLGMGQVWPINWKSSSRFNTSHIRDSSIYKGQVVVDGEGVGLAAPNWGTQQSMPGMTFMVCRTWGVPVLTGQAIVQDPTIFNQQLLADSTTSEVVLSVITKQKYFYQEVKYHAMQEYHEHQNFIPFQFRGQLTEESIMAQNQTPWFVNGLTRAGTARRARTLHDNQNIAQMPFNVFNENQGGNIATGGTILDAGYSADSVVTYP